MGDFDNEEQDEYGEEEIVDEVGSNEEIKVLNEEEDDSSQRQSSVVTTLAVILKVELLLKIDFSNLPVDDKDE